MNKTLFVYSQPRRPAGIGRISEVIQVNFFGSQRHNPSDEGREDIVFFIQIVSILFQQRRQLLDTQLMEFATVGHIHETS